MDTAIKELFISRISSGLIRIPIQNKVYFIHKLSPEQIYNAREYYLEVLKEAEWEGLYNDETLLNFMKEKDLWNDEDQSFLDKLPKEIEEFKYQMFKSTFKSDEVKVIRKALNIAKSKLSEVFNKRNFYNHLSCSGLASMSMSKYMIGTSLHTSDGKKVFGDDFWDEDSSLLDKVMLIYSRSRISDIEYREIARTDPWTTVWYNRKVATSLFNCSSIEHSEEQTNLISWSNLYENIAQHPECPPNDIINDDDIIDGWLIDQRRQREQRLNKSQTESLIKNDKIKNSQEVYLIANTTDDAKKIIDSNDAHAKMIQKQRFDYLKKKGEVNEADMPDTKRNLQMQHVQAISSSMKG